MEQQGKVAIVADNARIATEVLAAVGGPENVQSVLHCMTRLRFNLKDGSKKDDRAVKAVKGVLGAQTKGGQYQVIIGTNVPDVYDEVVKAGVQAGGSVDEDLSAQDEARGRLTVKQVGSNILDYISGSVVPLISVIVTGALFKTLAAVFGPTMLGVFAEDSQFVFLCNMIYNAAFYFMPVMAGAAAAKKLGMSSFLGAFMGAALIEPSFVALVGTDAAASFNVFGLSAPVLSYGSTLIPALLSVWVMSYVYKFIDGHLPNSVRTVFAPFFTMLVMLPVAFCALAPLGNYIGEALAAFFTWIGTTPFDWLGVTLLAAVWGLLVLTGMHLGFAAVALAQYAQNGQDTFILLAANIQVWAYAGAMLAICLRLRNKEQRGLAWSYLFTNVIGGVGEPMLFGFFIPYKRPFVPAIIGSAVSGFIAAISGVILYTPIMGFLVPLSYMGAAGIMNEVMGVIAMAVGALVSFVISWFYSLTPEQRAGTDDESEQIERVLAA